MAHTADTYREFMLLYLSWPGTKPNVKRISKSIGIPQQTGSAWSIELVETGSLQGVERPAQAEIESYTKDVWQRDKHETYMQLRSINDMALDRVSETVESRDSFDALAFNHASKGLNLIMGAMGNIQGEPMGRVQIDHKHEHEHKGHVVLVPKPQDFNTLEDSRDAWNRFQNTRHAIEDGRIEIPAGSSVVQVDDAEMIEKEA